MLYCMDIHTLRRLEAAWEDIATAVSNAVKGAVGDSCGNTLVVGVTISELPGYEKDEIPQDGMSTQCDVESIGAEERPVLPEFPLVQHFVNAYQFGMFLGLSESAAEQAAVIETNRAAKQWGAL